MALLLPLFPLNIVVFPGEKLNLHIFESRYRQLVSDCFKENKVFGIPPFLKNGISPAGTFIQIREIEKTHTAGEMDIRTIGTGLFRIDEFYKNYPDKEYAGGKITDIEIID